MGIESVNYQCPACGGPLRYDGAKALLVCDHCDSEFAVTDIETRYASKQQAAEEKAQKVSVSASSDASGLDGAYVCSSCGAELVCDASTAVSECPYCGNPVVAADRLAGDFRPQLVIPFKLDHKAAKQALAKHYEGKILLPKSFAGGNRINEVQGVYVPFWLYDTEASGSAVFEATRSRTHYEGDDEVIETDHFTVERDGTMSFARVPVDGSTKMPDAHMDAIEPYDYEALVPFSVAYMPGFVANRYDEDCEACKARAERRMEESTVSALRETVVDEYDDATVESKQLDYTWEESDYALFPVWMLSTSWNGKSYLFAMNGQTGRMVGELPCSKPKLAIASVLFFVIGFVLSQILFMGENAFDPDYLAFDVEGILINIVAPLIIVIIADVLLVGQLKTANEATHADYYCGELDLTEKHDTFSHTETSVVMKDNKDD